MALRERNEPGREEKGEEKEEEEEDEDEEARGEGKRRFGWREFNQQATKRKTLSLRPVSVALLSATHFLAPADIKSATCHLLSREDDQTTLFSRDSPARSERRLRE